MSNFYEFRILLHDMSLFSDLIGYGKYSTVTKIVNLILFLSGCFIFCLGIRDIIRGKINAYMGSISLTTDDRECGPKCSKYYFKSEDPKGFWSRVIIKMIAALFLMFISVLVMIIR